MTIQTDDDANSGLILAAEECPPENFAEYHSFSSHDDLIIRKLIAHGPVLVRGGRGSGKSALLLEARRRMRCTETVFPVYVSLRYLPLLQSDGKEYIAHFCTLLSQAIRNEIADMGVDYDYEISSDQSALQFGLTALSQALSKRIVLLFDDAAHIGREKPLEVFFDLFRTISSNLTSCKASIYPGVTKFGIRFDVFNDSTVVDISRSDVAAVPNFFPDVMQARFPKLAQCSFTDSLSPDQFANLLGRAVVGNLRGFILACNRFEGQERIGIPEVTKCFIDMTQDYYWPLMEEVAPKLGVFEPLIECAGNVVDVIIEQVVRPVRERNRIIAADRVLIHRQIVAQYMKLFEILEYLGFLARREASRSMKSGGRGPIFAINLCNILDKIPTRRLTNEMIDEWIRGKSEAAEIHVSSHAFRDIIMPELPPENALAILDKPVNVLFKSKAYPYGLTQNLIERLQGAGIKTVGELASAKDEQLDKIDYLGTAKIKRIHEVVHQAIWM
jgi:hypothetical protein